MKNRRITVTILVFSLISIMTLPNQPPSSACSGSSTSVCVVSQTACLKTMVLAKATPLVVVLPPATPVVFSAPVTLFIACPTRDNCGNPCPTPATPTSASLTVSLFPFPCPPPLPPPTATGTISTAAGTMTLPTCAPTGPGFNPYSVPITIPAGTPFGVYCVIGTATVTFSDGTVLTATGDTIVCLVEPAPGRPGIPRLDLRLITPTFPRCAPGDQVVATYRITNNDPAQSVTLTAFATGKQIALRPRGGNERQGVYSIANPFGDDFPIAFTPPRCIPLPGHPYTQGELRRTLGTLRPGQSTLVNIGIRSYGQCGSGSCSESTLRVEGTFSGGTPARACAGMAAFVDTSIRTKNCGFGINDCNRNGIPDAVDISSGRSQDRNFNAVPDECEQGAPIIEGPIQVSPPVVAPGQQIRIQVIVVGQAPIAAVFANGMPLTNRGGMLWEGNIPADREAGPQTVYALAKDANGNIATHIGVYEVRREQTAHR